MGEVLFSIKDLSCAYDNKQQDKILYIKNLEIPNGKLVFLLGASGCGKSTLLETLGLMNNTVAGGKITLYPNSVGADEVVELTSLWKEGNESQLNTIRKKYYSFIFQNTNLMENFTAYENVCLSGMIKENIAQQKVLEDAKVLMEKVKLSESEVNVQTLAMHLSGGQRQRLAFVRALNNKAAVLFGDEPTGNLDEVNANELVEIIRGSLINHSSGIGLSAIIVSHDIDLAVKYADTIIVITKDANKGYGEVHTENIYARQENGRWPVTDNEAFKEKLRSFYHAANEHKIPAPAEKGDIDTGVKYKELFITKEGKILFGKKWLNLIVLCFIMFFTFLAIGFANGSLDYLNKKMNSAFVNWISITIPLLRGSGGDIDKIVTELKLQENKDKYFYETISPYVRKPIFVWDSKRSDFFPVKARSIKVDDDGQLIAESILDKKNIIHGNKNGFTGQKDIAVIVTARFLEEHNYPEDANIIYVDKPVTDKQTHKPKDVRVPIEVRAIVNELPGKYDLIYPVYFYQAFVNGDDPDFDISVKNTGIDLFLQSNDDVKANKLKKSIVDYFEKHHEYDQYKPGIVFVKPDTLGFVGGYDLQFDFDPAPSYDTVKLLANDLIYFARADKIEDSIFRVYKYNNVNINYKDPSWDEVSVYFSKLDRVRDFADNLRNKFNEHGDNRDNEVIEVDTNTVTEKENFSFLSTVARIISYLLVIFSTLAISLFIFNLLKGHLAKVKMNIGTFKAIGLEDSEARSIYFVIIFRFILVAAIASLILSGFFGYLINKILVSNLIVEKDINYFRLLDWNTLIAFVTVLASAFLISWLTIKKMLNKTPGDLIYNR